MSEQEHVVYSISLQQSEHKLAYSSELRNDSNYILEGVV